MDHSRFNRDSAIAAAITFVVALLLLLALYYGGVTFDREVLAQASTPEIIALPEEEEEEFIEPELLTEAADHDADTEAAAPNLHGEPEKAPEDNPRAVVPDKNPNPAPPIEKPIVQKKESPVKAVTPPATDEDKKKATSKVGSKFSGRNGSESGSPNASGVGGTGVGKAKGDVNGRRFISCPSPVVASAKKGTFNVIVRISVDANGDVKKAEVSRSNGLEPAVLQECKGCALKAKWDKKEGAPLAKGTLTFTITFK